METIYGIWVVRLFSAYTTPNTSVADEPTGPARRMSDAVSSSCEVAQPVGWPGAAPSLPLAVHPGGVNASM
jgi:hypothetical protein